MSKQSQHLMGSTDNFAREDYRGLLYNRKFLQKPTDSMAIQIVIFLYPLSEINCDRLSVYVLNFLSSKK